VNIMVRSVDVQQVLLHINSVERVQQVHQQHPDVQQRYFEDRLNKQRKESKEKIKKGQETENPVIKDEKQERESREHSLEGDGQNEQKKAESLEQALSDNDRGRTVDIKV